MNMQWRRGLTRLWLVLSGAWLGLWFFVLLVFGDFRHEPDLIKELGFAALFIFGPPLLLAGLMSAGAWTIKGFKKGE
jgi:hypothetical protein